MSAIWKSWERRTRKSKKITGQARETFLFFFAWHPGGHQCPILYQFSHKTLRQMLEPLLEQESQTQLMLLFFFTPFFRKMQGQETLVFNQAELFASS